MSIIRELVSDVKTVAVFKPAKVEATINDITPVDLNGFNSVLFTAIIGESSVNLGNDNQVRLELQHSDRADGGFAACSDEQVKNYIAGENSGTFANVRVAIPDAGLSFATSYTGHKRYVRPVIRCSGAGHGGDAHNGTLIAIGAVLHGAKYLPVCK